MARRRAVDLDAMNGWLGPDGRFYACGSMPYAHAERADAICIEKGWPEHTDLDSKGFVRLRGGEWWFGEIDDLTQQQIDTIADWDDAHRAWHDEWGRTGSLPAPGELTRFAKI